MKSIDLYALAQDQIVAEQISLHPVGELDEAGARWPTDMDKVTFLLGDLIAVFDHFEENVTAYRNYAKPPTYGLPPYLFRRDDIARVMVKDVSPSTGQGAE